LSAGLDGNTSAQERERLINRFNAPENTDVLLFMLSTRYTKSSYFGSSLTTFGISYIYQRNEKMTEELKAKETCTVPETKFASSGPVDSCVASMSAQMAKRYLGINNLHKKTP